MIGVHTNNKMVAFFGFKTFIFSEKILKMTIYRSWIL